MSSSLTASRPASKETDEERARRRADKAAKVGAHRTDVLRRLNTKSARLTLHKADTFVAPVRFENRLPEVPVEQRYIAYPFDEDLVYALDVTQGISSDAAAPRVFHPEPDVGVGLALGLLDPAQYFVGGAVLAAQRHPADVAICAPDFALPATAARAVIADTERIEWLMRSQMLHNDLYDSVYKHNDPVSAAAAELDKERIAFELVRSSRPRAVRVAASFAAASALDAAAARGELRHPLTPALVARRVWTLLPEVEAPGLHLVEVAIDREPGVDVCASSRASKRVRLSRAIVRTAPAQSVDLRSRSTTVHLLLPEPPRTAHDTVPLFAPEGEYSLEHSEPARGEQQFVIRWHPVSGEATFAHVCAKAALVRVANAGAAGGSADAGALAAVVRRAPTEAEEDDVDDARARARDADAASALSKVTGRRRARASTARAETERVLAACAAASAASDQTSPTYAADVASRGSLGAAVDDDLFDEEE